VYHSTVGLRVIKKKRRTPLTIYFFIRAIHNNRKKTVSIVLSRQIGGWRVSIQPTILKLTSWVQRMFFGYVVTLVITDSGLVTAKNILRSYLRLIDFCIAQR